MGRISCIFQSGASYHTSPATISSLPSLLMSATATPSERNFLSMTVFFQRTWDAGTPPDGPSAAATNATTIATDALRTRNLDRITGRSPLENWLADYFGPF